MRASLRGMILAAFGLFAFAVVVPGNEAEKAQPESALPHTKLIPGAAAPKGQLVPGGNAAKGKLAQQPGEDADAPDGLLPPPPDGVPVPVVPVPQVQPVP